MPQITYDQTVTEHNEPRWGWFCETCDEGSFCESVEARSNEISNHMEEKHSMEQQIAHLKKILAAEPGIAMDAVNDMKDSEASAINNGGYDAQADYLIEALGGVDEAIDYLLN
jgi:hypothetical protein